MSLLVESKPAESACDWSTRKLLRLIWGRNFKFLPQHDAVVYLLPVG